MKRLTLYMFREAMIAFLFAVIAISFVVLFTQSFRLLSFVIDNAGTTLIFFQLMGLLMPTFLPIVIPLSLGISIIFIYHKLAVDSEIVVMRASGLSTIRLALPALVLAVMVTALCYMFTTWITPAANRELVKLQYRVRDNFSVYLIRPGNFNDITDGLTFYVRARGKNGEMHDILVHDVRNTEMPITIMADSGRFQIINNEPQIVVFKGKRQEFDRNTGRLSQLEFDRYVLNLKLLRGKASSRPPDPREQTMLELLNPPSDPAKRRKSPEHSRAEFHQRLAFPLLAFGYALIGLTAVLAGNFNRRGMTGRILIAAIAIIAVQAGAFSLGSLIVRHFWSIPVLYAFVVFPSVFCLAVLSSPNLWYMATNWKNRFFPIAKVMP